MPIRSRSAALALGLSLARVPLAVSSPAPPPATGFSEAIDVDVVGVQVFVADRSGRPVAGLGRGDFELRVDGKAVPITNFYAGEGRAGRPAAAPGPAGAVPPAGSPEAAAAAAVAEDQRLNLAVFVDNLNLSPESRNEALRSLSQFFRTGLHRDDRVLLASYDGWAVKLRQPPIGDAEAVVRAFREVATATARGGFAGAEERKALQDLGNAARDAEAAEATERLAMIDEQRQGDAQTLLKTLARFVDSLGGLRGRKALLYLTGDLRIPDGDRRLAEVIRHANADGVVVYGLGATVDLTAVAFETTKIDFVGAPAAQARSDDLLATLQDLARPTGGLAGVDLNRPAALLDRIRDDFASFYSLGFAPGPAAGGGTHRLEVRVPGHRGLAVRFPASYVPRSREERLADRTETALVYGGGGGGGARDNPLGVRLGFERDESIAYGRRMVTVLVMVPLARIALEPDHPGHPDHPGPPGAGVHAGRVVLFVAARDSHGTSLRLRRIAIPIRVADGELAASLAKSAAYRVKLELPPGASTLAVSLRDELGGTESTVATSFTAGAMATAAATAPRPAPPKAP